MSSETANVAALLMGVGEDLVLQEQPVPTPGASEVLIRNHALAVNPVDWKLQTLGFMGGPYPKILGAGSYTVFCQDPLQRFSMEA